MSFRVGIIGSGNWGTTVSKIVGETVSQLEKFENEVLMWVYEEVIGGNMLTHIINSRHENVKYLPGIKLPQNVVAVSDIFKVVENSTHLVFVLPHQFVCSTCDQIASHVRPGAVGISLIKGLIETDGNIGFISRVIGSKLGIHMSVLSGANVASEIAAEKFSTTTIGSDNETNAKIWESIFSTPYFKVALVPYTLPLEICGALKNCVAAAVGFAEALGFGNNTKASTIRIGLLEMVKFVKLYQPDCDERIFFESFGFDDLITTSFGGRNVKAAEMFIRTKKALSDIEKELLNGQKLEGPGTIKVVYKIISSRGLEKEFPLLCYIYKVFNEGLPAEELVNALRSS